MSAPSNTGYPTLKASELARNLARRPRFLALPLAALLLPLTVAIAGGVLSWRATWREARTSTQDSANAGAEFVSGTVSGYVAALKEFNAVVSGLDDSEILSHERQISESLNRILGALPLALTGYIVDRDGHALVSATVWPVPRDTQVIADPALLRPSSDAGPSGVDVSAVHGSTLDGLPIFALSLRRGPTAGTGATVPGLVEISVSPDRLSASLSRLSGNRVHMTLVNAAGNVLAASGPSTGATSPDPVSPRSMLGQHIVAGTGGAEFLLSVTRVADLPLFITTSRPLATIRADWTWYFAQHLIFGVPATVSLFLLSLLVRRHWIRLRRDEAALRDSLIESEAHLRRLQATAGSMAFEMAANGSIRCSNGLRALLGVPDDTPMSLATLAKGLGSAEADALEAALREKRAEGGSLNRESRYQRDDGAELWLLIAAEAEAPPRGAGRVSGVMMDVTARHTWETQLRLSERRLRESLRTLDLAAVFVRDMNGRVTYWSEGCASLFGWGATEMIGEDAAAMLRTELPVPAGAVEEALAEAGEWNGDVVKYRRDGTPLTVAIRRVLQRNDDGTPAAILESCVDVTELRRSREALRELNLRLEGLVKEEVEKRLQAQSRAAHGERLQALGELAGGIAHDLNNVLQAVSSGASLVTRRANHSDEVRMLATLMRNAATRGMSVTRRMLMFSRQENPRAESIDPLGILNDLLDTLRHILGGHATCRIEASEDLPPLRADRGQLETALINLATNARDAMPDGGTIVFGAAEESKIAGDALPDKLAPGDYIRLWVTDSGAGMDAETLHRVTEPFFTTKEAGHGTGLGLPMAASFVAQFGGAIRVESEPGKGTTVSLWLPRATAPVDADDGAVGLDGVTRSARVLLADDDSTVRFLLARELETTGYRVQAVADGIAALAALTEWDDQGRAPFDILVCDYSMPTMSGLETIRQARAGHPDLPVILITGHAVEPALLKGEAAHIPVLRKPVATETLIAAIDRAIAAEHGVGDTNGESGLSAAVGP